MTSDLLLALLSMDAYNHGFGAGIPDVGTKIGGASVSRRFDQSSFQGNDDGPANTGIAA
jgi:hypothetical protein